MGNRRIPAVFFVSFLYLLVWIGLAFRLVPDAVEEITSDSVYQAILNIAISGTLLVVPAYVITLYGLGGRTPPPA